MKTGRVAAGMAIVIATAGCQEHIPAAISSQLQQPVEAAPQQAQTIDPEAKKLDQLPPVIPAEGIDRSGRKQIGKASYYARNFDGRRMADGHRFRRTANVAASKTLPIGTTAKVTNVATGKSAIVTVQDRGPFVHGRVLDVSPWVAEQIGMLREGVVRVVVKPIAVPKPDGSVKLGAGAAETPEPLLQKAIETAESTAAAE